MTTPLGKIPEGFIKEDILKRRLNGKTMGLGYWSAMDYMAKKKRAPEEKANKAIKAWKK